MIYTDSESVLVSGDNRKQNPDGYYTIKYEKVVAGSYYYKLVCADDKFIRPFRSYLREELAYSIINSMLKDRKHCSDVKKKHLNKEFIMTKKDFFSVTKL